MHKQFSEDVPLLKPKQKHYDDLSGPRVRQLEKPMDKIIDLELKNSDNDQIENDAA